jgi:hypothetical protein
MTAPLLDRSVPYQGARLTVAGLEAALQSERTRQTEQMATLDKLRTRNVAVQSALAGEMNALQGLSAQLDGPESSEGVATWLRRTFSFLPGVDAQEPGSASVEALLREQFEASQARLSEAAAFTDRLEVAQTDLYDEVDRLNGRIVEAAENEGLAAAHLLAVEAHQHDLIHQRERAPDAATRQRVQAELDRCKRVLAEHATRLKLYDTAADRLAQLKLNTQRLAETVAHLRSDIGRYVMAASEKLDLVSGQINAVGVAADATAVMIELKQALSGMTASLNEATRFVSRTQRYFRENIDGLIDELEVYDDETRRVLDANLAYADAADDLRIDEAVTLARTQRRL